MEAAASEALASASLATSATLSAAVSLSVLLPKNCGEGGRAGGGERGRSERKAARAYASMPGGRRATCPPALTICIKDGMIQGEFAVRAPLQIYPKGGEASGHVQTISAHVLLRSIGVLIGNGVGGANRERKPNLAGVTSSLTIILCITFIMQGGSGSRVALELAPLVSERARAQLHLVRRDRLA